MKAGMENFNLRRKQSEAADFRTLTSPSPQPSPLGRGRSDCSRNCLQFPLSPRERVGVRGNETSNPASLVRTYESSSIIHHPSPFDPRPSTLDPRPSSGVALVITLVMLSVIAFMAVTFLLVSHSERNQVATTTEQNVAAFAADQATERAKADIMAGMLTFTNPYALH